MKFVTDTVLVDRERENQGRKRIEQSMIIIEQGDSSPYVKIDEIENLMLLRGNSFSANPKQLFAEVLEWGREYKVPGGQRFKIEITVGYYSTSHIQLLNLFLKTLNSNNPGLIDVVFIVDQEDEEDLDEVMLSLTFNTGITHKVSYS